MNNKSIILRVVMILLFVGGVGIGIMFHKCPEIPVKTLEVPKMICTCPEYEEKDCVEEFERHIVNLEKAKVKLEEYKEVLE